MGKKTSIPGKLIALVIMVLSLLFGTLRISISADEIYSDKSYYDLEWTKIECNYWVKHSKEGLGFIDRTTCYIRIADTQGNLIDNITRLAVQYKIGNEIYTVEKDTLNAADFLIQETHSLSSFSKEGRVRYRNKQSDYEYDSVLSGIFTSNTSGDKPYEHSNYEWTWRWNVSEIIYMYAWYENTEGQEVAGSFFPNGEHPKFDNEGNLLGIYDVNDNLLSDATLDSSGMIVEIDPTTNKQTPLLSFDDQQVGKVIEEDDSFLAPFHQVINEINSTFKGTMKIIVYAGIVAAAIVILGVVIKFLKWVFK